MTRLQLKQEWELGALIGGGGFGKVYEATSASGDRAAVKLVPKVPGAEREMLFVNLDDARNVVPVIESGETADSWVIVMPRADKSLRQRLNEVAGPLGTADAVAILADIADALTDLDGKVVHRDLKPENVLLLNGRWSLADFGISRYAEATTAPDTRKHMFTPPYAAPEQWRAEHATGATDVYAFGVIAYELLAGTRPFTGPQMHDFREQHLHDDPTPIGNVPSLLAALVEECLYKAPGARPSPSDIVARLTRVADAPQSAGLAKLQDANHAQAMRQGVAARQQSEHQSEAERRAALLESARRSLKQVADALKEAIGQAAPLASFSVGLDIGWTVRLNQAEMRLAPPVATSPQPWGSWSPPAFEVVAHSGLSIQIPSNRYGYEGRSHSLWYCDAREPGKYQWFETAFMISPLIPRQSSQNPFALDPSENAAKAIGPSMAEWQVAWPFTVVSIGDLDDFIGRWAGWFADAAQGQLNQPSTMPERQAQGSWRRG
jgi:eukaryotic-like serine/threonine-protein kinase